MTTHTTTGLKANWKQFTLLVIINAFVGGMVGMERTLLPEIAQHDFQISAYSAMLSFIVVFGTVKAISNYAFNELNLKTLQIIAHKTNLASIKVAENNGFVWQRTLVDEFTPTYELSLDMELYEYTNEK